MYFERSANDNLRTTSDYTLYITGKCNLKCAHCMVGDLLPKINLPFDSFQKTFSELLKSRATNFKLPSIEELKIIAEQEGKTLRQVFLEYRSKLRKKLRLNSKLNQITIAGGEPTLHPEFKKFVLFASKISKDVLIDTNGATTSADFEKAEKQWNWLPKNARIMLSFDDFHYKINDPKYEDRIANLIEICIKKNYFLTINCVNPYKLLPKVKTPRLKKLLDEIQNFKHPDKVIQRRMPSAIGFAQFMLGLEKNSLQPVYRTIMDNNPNEITPDGNIYGSSEKAFLGLLNKDNPAYLGNIFKESLATIYERKQRKVFSDFAGYYTSESNSWGKDHLERRFEDLKVKKGSTEQALLLFMSKEQARRRIMERTKTRMQVHYRLPK